MPSDLTATLCPPSLFRSGFVQTSVGCKGHIVVICELWPSWLFVLPALRLRCNTVVLTVLMVTSPSWLPHLQQLFPAVTFVSSVKHLPATSFEQSTFLLTHGSPAWYLQHRHTWPSLPCISSFTTRMSADTRFEDLPYQHFSSVDAGSVLDFRWFCLLPHIVPPPRSYHRCLDHIIDPTTKVARSDRLPSVNSWVSSKSLPLSRIHLPVQCRSVFSRSGWVVRPLSNVELGRLYDLPPRVCQLFADHPRRDLPWLASPPMKFLHYISSCIFGGGRGCGWSQRPPCYGSCPCYRSGDNGGSSSCEAGDGDNG
jgi:hypothetical protein